MPPPVTGRTVVTARLVEEFARRGIPYWVLNTAVAATGPPLRRKLRRTQRLTLCALRLFREQRRATMAYIPVDATPGTIFTALYVAGARLAGARITLHHHSYSYVSSPTLAMRGLCRIAGRNAVHVTPCATMSAELSARYRDAERTAVLTNAFAIEPELATVRRHRQRDRLTLGHLSNLTVAKGTLTAIQCFGELRRRGEPVELHLAGPIQDDVVERAIRKSQVDFGQAFHHHGPSDAAGKRAFYAALDVFLFPTTFRNEVQPLVVLEALAAGIPTIAFGRARIPPLLEGGAGLVVPCDADFRAAAVRQIMAWHRDRAALAAAGVAARKRFEQLHRQSLTELGALVGELAGEQRDQRIASPRTTEHGPVKPILFVGPLPPPVTGRTVATAELRRRLAANGLTLHLINIAPAETVSRLMGRLSRLGRFAAACRAILAGSQHPDWAYLAVDAGPGMYITAACALLARLRGLKLVLHHHNYSYIAQPTLRMNILTKASGTGALHVTLCAAMSCELRRRYPGVRHTLDLSNVYTLRSDVHPKLAQPERFTLGHLSNLRVEKGLKTVINCYRLLRQRGVDAALRLGGPAADREAAAIIQAAKSEFPDDLVHDGPIYGHAKNEFYRNISVFLFPSENEAQGIVNLEALAAGTPVIAYGRCCIPADLANGGGCVIPVEAAFEEMALPRLLLWAKDPTALSHASAAARRRFEQLQTEGDGQLTKLLEALVA